MFSLLFIFVIGEAGSTEFSVVGLVLFFFVIPTVVVVCLFGYPIFKFMLIKLGSDNTFFKILLAGFLSTLVPIFIMAMILGFVLDDSNGLKNLLTVWLFMLAFSFLFLLPSTFMYWRWGKNA